MEQPSFNSTTYSDLRVQVIAAGRSLLNGTLGIEHGTMFDGMLAYFARDFIVSLQLDNLTGEAAIALKSFKNAITRTITGSCLRWRAEAVETAVKKLSEAIGTPEMLMAAKRLQSLVERAFIDKVKAEWANLAEQPKQSGALVGASGLIEPPSHTGIPFGGKARPTWDAEMRELRVGDTICRRYKRAAPAQFRVFNAFQDMGWPTSVHLNLDSNQTIVDINKGLRVLRFRKARGCCIEWHYTDSR